jgi:hypothetical protein
MAFETNNIIRNLLQTVPITDKWRSTGICNLTCLEWGGNWKKKTSLDMQHICEIIFTNMDKQKTAWWERSLKKGGGQHMNIKVNFCIYICMYTDTTTQQKNKNHLHTHPQSKYFWKLPPENMHALGTIWPHTNLNITNTWSLQHINKHTTTAMPHDTIK